MPAFRSIFESLQPLQRGDSYFDLLDVTVTFDDVRLSTRALSAQEVADLYNLGR